MSNTSHSASAARYANALFQLAKEAKVLDSISSDLEKIIKFLLSDSDIASFIENPSVKNTNKLSVLNVASDKLELSKLTKDFIGVVTKKGRISNIREIITSFKDLVADMHGIKNAKVSSAKKLSDTQEDQIKQKLKEKFNSDFILHIPQFCNGSVLFPKIKLFSFVLIYGETFLRVATKLLFINISNVP